MWPFGYFLIISIYIKIQNLNCDKEKFFPFPEIKSSNSLTLSQNHSLKATEVLQANDPAKDHTQRCYSDECPADTTGNIPANS